MNKSLLYLFLLVGSLGVSHTIFSQDIGTPEELNEMSATQMPEDILLETTDIQVPDQVSIMEGPEIEPQAQESVIEMAPEAKETAEKGLPTPAETEKITPVAPSQEEEMMPKKLDTKVPTEAPETPKSTAEKAPELPAAEEPVVNLPAVTTMTESAEEKPVVTPTPAETPEIPMPENGDKE